ncbi:helix-turn-helix domain-containing protein [Leeuwenhoekiella polynyae]|uniref:Helix-turn-helix protein n=1 Tax=Leeuwenhoekiella polynyae TaxID=1550906 RepID=A0A4Q0P1J1_9FLAO|nr:helix-turn-helix domain-containing protein [Leeuwenhoekiella polynyae]RXG20344.1 helix-turn-helix protein [Leeuwenhoekiella polynyae]|tara:strand:+ start:47 stop:259 length:213 start_codon:yes stop_codon:yes gene_type:complete
MSKKSIGIQLKERRDHLKITQYEVADLAGISVNTLYKIERGQANPTLESLEKLTSVLGLELTLQLKSIEV